MTELITAPAEIERLAAQMIQRQAKTQQAEEQPVILTPEYKRAAGFSNYQRLANHQVDLDAGHPHPGQFYPGRRRCYAPEPLP